MSRMSLFGSVYSKCGPLLGAVDQGTSSTRFLVFASTSLELLTYHQIEIKQIFPKEGWVEEDPLEILNSVHICINKVVENLRGLEIDPADIKAIGITNQRETTIVWDKVTGKPLYNALVWLDSRTGDTVEKLLQKLPGKNQESIKRKCGLPLSTYFSAVKLRWLIDNVPEIATAIEEERCLFGTVDSWLIWNLTGGKDGGYHITDVTNASRTMLMDVETLKWDSWLCNFFDIPESILPKIHSCAEIYGFMCSGSLQGVPLSGCLGDQSAALVGQMCFSIGEAKNTYGTGCFLLYNTGIAPVWSDHGLLTTVGYKLGPNEQTYYALEGSVAIAGAAVRWLRDNLGIISASSDVDKLASSVSSTHGVYFVPAFSGLYAPYWQPDARGIICGLTQFTTKAHLARASLEAVCFQTKEILDAMNKDCDGPPLRQLQVDGGMTASTILLQLQADLLGIPVVCPSMPETTALGAAMAAGAADGIKVWNLSKSDLTTITTDKYFPTVRENEREQRFEKWKEAVQRSMHWETNVTEKNNNRGAYYAMMSALPGGVFIMSSFAFLVIAEHIAQSSAS